MDKFLCDWPDCGKRFAYKSDFADHLRGHNGDRPFVCDFEGCEAAFRRSSTLKVHRRTHTSERPFRCDFGGCGAAFAQFGSLTSHKRTHSGERPFVCAFEGCKAAFAQSNSLTTHKRTHSGERPFICKFEGCQAAFAQSSGLTTHERTHTGKRPFVCDFEGCVSSFAQSGGLTIHKRSHSGSKPYKCNFMDCTRSFATSDQMKIHRRRHENAKPYQCDFADCDKAFVTSTGCSAHKRIHDIKTPPDNAVAGEIFREIPGVKNYQVSNQGRVRNGRNFKVLSQSRTRGGYKMVSLLKRMFSVHRLVMLAFVGPVPDNRTVDHIDRNPSNNNLCNLRYATSREQMMNRVFPTSNKSSAPVEKVCSNGAPTRYSSVKEAAQKTLTENVSLRYVMNCIYRAVGKGSIYQLCTWRYVRAGVNYVWKDIPPLLLRGHKGYSASPTGEIRLRNGRITSGCLTADGYYAITISHKTYLVHRLIAATFLPPPENEKQRIVNHIDGVRDNNHIENLEFVTCSENSMHAHNTGLTKKRRPVKQFSREGKFLAEFSSLAAAAKSIGVRSDSLSLCCSGKAKTAYGFVWNFSDMIKT
jgi:uncharacterized Zn-finger protein